MPKLIATLRWIARLDGLCALILGTILWSGSFGLVRAHIVTGFVMTITLLLVAVIGFARIRPALPIIGVAWALLIPYFGFAQLRLLPGPSHVVVQVIHLLIGIGAIGLVETLGAKITRKALTGL